MAEQSVGVFSEKREVFGLSEIYDPDKTAAENDGKIIPRVNNVVFDGTTLYVVSAVDSVTNKTTLSPATLVVFSGDDDTTTSVVSYRNDIFWLYYTNRVVPTKIIVDGLLKVTGSHLANYRLSITNAAGNKVIVSRYYDEDGSYKSDMAPMLLISDNIANERYAAPANSLYEFTPGESVLMEVFNTFGELVAVANLFAAESTISNTLDTYIPTIVSMKIKGSQMTTDGELFVFGDQDVGSLAILLELTYNDGSVRELSFDGDRSIITGLTDFTSSFPGLRQPLVAKYYLSEDERAEGATVTGDVRFLHATTNIRVVMNEFDEAFKIVAIPIWYTSPAAYRLRYYAYDVDGKWMLDITDYTTIVQGSFVGNNYGVWQNFVVQVDRMDMPIFNLNETAVYLQTMCVLVQPNTMYEKYLIKENIDSSIVYGVDVASDRRPIISYDATRKQFFIPSTIFANKESVIRSFYRNAVPPFNNEVVIEAPDPTHFMLRDALTGASMLRNPVPLATYSSAFTITDTNNPGRYLNNTVIVEFLLYVNDTTYNQLVGVPVDIKAGTYQG